MLVVENLNAGYAKKTVIKDISFQLEKGSILCVLGENGSGRTTLLRAIAGLIQSTGLIELDGKPLLTGKRRQIAKKIAILQQNEAVYFPYTVYQTVSLGRYVHLQGGFLPTLNQEDEARVASCLETVGMYNCRDQLISELSGGQLQRVFLARLLAQEPEVILLDEPTNHLDLKTQVFLTDFLKAHCEKTGTIVIGVMHDLNLVLRMADNLIFLKEGRALKFGATREVIDAEILERTFGMDVAGYLREVGDMWGSSLG